MQQATAAGAPSPAPRAGKWLDGAALEGDRWVDPSDAAAVDAWGTAPRQPTPRAFDPQRASLPQQEGRQHPSDDVRAPHGKEGYKILFAPLAGSNL